MKAGDLAGVRAKTVGELLEALGLSMQEYVVLVNASPVPESEPLHEGDKIELLKVM